MNGIAHDRLIVDIRVVQQVLGTLLQDFDDAQVIIQRFHQLQLLTSRCVFQIQTRYIGCIDQIDENVVILQIFDDYGTVYVFKAERRQTLHNTYIIFAEKFCIFANIRT